MINITEKHEFPVVYNINIHLKKIEVIECNRK